MGRPTKFTEPRKKRILEALEIGCSRRTACALAGIDVATLGRWLERGRNESAGPWVEFYRAVEEAEAKPNARAVGIVWREMENKPDLAWKFIERREPGYAPPLPQIDKPARPIVIQLSLSDGSPLAMGEVVEGEVVDEQDEQPAEATDTPALGP